MSDWLRDYVTYTESQESPERFHLWAGVACIASAINRNIYLVRTSKDGIDRYTVYPGSLGIVLVAGSGAARKTTAIAHMAQPLLREAGVAEIFDGKITPERLLAKLAGLPNKRAVLTIIQDELATFLSKASYNEGMINQLTKLMDCKDDKYENQSAVYELRSVCVTQLLGTTPRHLGQHIPPTAHDTGFLGRYCFVYAEESGKIDPLTSARMDPIRGGSNSITLRASLVSRLQDMSHVVGSFTWSAEGRTWFDDWYAMYRQTPESKIEGWAQKKPDHLLRIAMVAELSSGNYERTLCPASLRFALHALREHVELNLPKSLAYIGRHPMADAYERLINTFGDNGRLVTSRELYERTLYLWPDIRALRAAIQALQTAGIIKHKGQNEEGIDTWQLIKKPE